MLETYWKGKTGGCPGTLDNEETELAGDFILTLFTDKPKLYGEGRSEKAVYYLDKGVVSSPGGSQ